MVKEIEFICKNIPTKQNPHAKRFTLKPVQHFQGEIMTILYELFWKIKGEDTSQLILKGQHYPATKMRQRHSNKEN